MITYVNTVLVGTVDNGPIVTSIQNSTSMNTPNTDAGKFVVLNVDESKLVQDLTSLKTYNRFKVGLITAKNSVKIEKDGTRTYVPVIKWSNIIGPKSVKAYAELVRADYDTAVGKGVPTEDTIKIDFSKLDANVLQSFQQGGKRIIVRLTFKDLPTRFRKWTESYEYVTKSDEDTTAIAVGIANLINKQWKRARVSASANAGVVTLKAMPYDDDNSVDTINVANKVRFNANVYYTDPTAAAFASRNKYFPTGVEITKTPGITYQADAKIVRDREAQAMGYEGILNRGCCTWPIIKPDMNTDLSKTYNGITYQFENEYHTADDLTRSTKETLEIYFPGKVETDLTKLTVRNVLYIYANNNDVIKDKVVYPA